MTNRRRVLFLVGAAALAFCLVSPLAGDSAETASPVPAAQGEAAYHPALLQALRYRFVGPYRGGRSTAVAGVADDIFTYYMGTTGGGVWKTTDGGVSWQNVSDGYFEAGSIGAIAVATSDTNVVYVGTGSACPRGNISPGVGMYKSNDAGTTWKHIGLRDAGQIGKLAVHPNNPDLVYVAALGHIFGPNKERGVFRSKDGGASWDKVLYLSEQTGAVDIKMDANNPRILYAAFWRVERKPWTLISGAREGGIYKTTDGGDTWKELTRGLPEGLTGRIGIAVSPADSNRVWAIIEGERTASGFEKDESGLYRSDDAGKTWQYVNGDSLLHQRPWYYHHLVADPQDENTLYHVGSSFWRSVDAGRSFETIAVPHVDQHDLWINPRHPEIMIEANDGGATVSFNRGKSWSSQLNQPTAEMYGVAVDEQFPYRLYGGQQDYPSAISVPSAVTGARGITRQDWLDVGGGEQGPVAVNPRNPDVIYAGGNISRMDRATGEIRRIMDYPQYWMGLPARELRYRFQAQSPIHLSPHDPDVVYNTSQYVHRSRDGGQSWELISPDLTRHDDSKLGVSGGPLTHDLTSIETYCTITAFEESRRTPGLLWVGSDDGLVHVSRDGGAHWDNVTPPEMPEWGTVSMVEPSSHAPGRALIAVHRYRLDDFRPYIFRTNDYGASWQLISRANGIPEDHIVRVVREDPDRQGLLYAGTEFGLYVSFDDGGHWQPLQLNLPVTPVMGLVVHHQDLVVATQGRGFWILDNVTHLHQLSPEVAQADVYLLKPRAAWRTEGGGQYLGGATSREDEGEGENPPQGVMVFYGFRSKPQQEVRLEVLDAAGHLVRSWSSSRKKDALPAEAGMNRFVWDLSYPGAEVIPGSRLDGYTGGPRTLPGHYQVRMSLGTWSRSEAFEVLMDPRSKSTLADLQAQFDLLVHVRDKITEAHNAVRAIQAVREQMKGISERTRAAGPAAIAKGQGDWEAFLERLDKAERSIGSKLDAIEDKLRQKRSKVYDDTENFPPLLDDQLAFVASQTISADTRPTDSAILRYRDLDAELAAHVAQLKGVLETDVPAFNRIMRESGLGAVIVPSF